LQNEPNILEDFKQRFPDQERELTEARSSQALAANARQGKAWEALGKPENLA
jgi:hypothetical protein